jgi:hypothetical protein
VEYISSKCTTDEAILIAHNLLRLLGLSNMDFTQVQGISERKWLPTNQGLCSADECRHAVLTPSALFDRVLATLEPFTIPPLLQSALHWDEPLHTGLLIRQLDSLLDFELNYDAVVEVVKELGRRPWSDDSEELGTLKTCYEM